MYQGERLCGCVKERTGNGMKMDLAPEVAAEIKETEFPVGLWEREARNNP